MKIVFGLWADGGAWPDHGGDAPGSLGQPVVGPNGLVDILETLLGLGGPATAQVVRIAHFQSHLESLGGAYFWSRSLAVDSWSTARTLLAWRDDLVGLGWRANISWQSPRLADLAAASSAATDLPRGLNDRIVGVLDALNPRAAAAITHIRMIDDPALCPAAIRRLIHRLAELGTAVGHVQPVPAAAAETALGRLQRWMLGDNAELGTADESVTLATSASASLAAEVLGDWFASRSGEAIALVAQDGDTGLLDHGLGAAGQPRAGRSRTSVHRGSLQLLLLTFKAHWGPFDPRAILEILVFPNSPVAPRAAWRLAAALEAAPGRGGEEWLAAWQAIGDAERERAGTDADEIAKIEPRLARWRTWTEPKTANPETGMPIAQALQICDLVSTWAGSRYGIGEDPLYAATATLAREVRGALAALGRNQLPRLLVERIIDQALDLGQANPGAVAEAANWRSVQHPGSVWAPARTLVWWNFSATTEGSERAPWSDAERAELAAADCPADAINRAAQAASAAWERAILNAGERVLLVSGGLSCDAEDNLHPLAHRLKPAIDRLATRTDLEAALRAPVLSLSSVELARQAAPPQPLALPRFAWTTPPGFAAKLADRAQSATSLENLFSCQLLWALRHVAGLRPGRVRSIPDGNQLLGNLAHAIAREIFQPGPPPKPEAAATATQALLEARIDQLAAPLRHPELADALNLARRRLPAAMASLAKCLGENELTVEATEQQVSGEFEALLAMRGAVDLVARDANGNAVIIDLKWTRSEKSRIDELTTGRAVQLATYGALVSPGQLYRAGYFLLNQRQFATLAGNGLIGREVEGSRGFPATWQAIVEGWKIWSQHAEAGQLLATGVDGVADLVPAEIAITREVHCEWCDYATLCRVRGLA